MHRPVLLAALLVLLASAATALDINVATDFSNLHAAGETSARLKVCAGLATGVAGDAEKKIECVKFLVDSGAACAASGLTSTCTVNGVTLILDEVEFVCDGGTYDGATVVPPATCMMDVPAFVSFLAQPANLGACPAANSDDGSNGGYTGGACSISARCHYVNDNTASEFGDYCPAATGTTCCGTGIAVSPGAFPDNVATTLYANLTRLEIDHVVDLDIDISYEVQAPADLKISVQVPYVTSTSVVNLDGVNYNLCPSAYLVDFTDPIETSPPSADYDGTLRGGSTPFPSTWTPLTHMPTYDLAGAARSICAAQDFAFNPAVTTAGLNFDYPDPADFTTSVNYNSGSRLAADVSVWTDATDVPTDYLWEGAIEADKTRFTWSTKGFFDVVRTYSKCQRKSDGARLVAKTIEPELSYINGGERRAPRPVRVKVSAPRFPALLRRARFSEREAPPGGPCARAFRTT